MKFFYGFQAIYSNIAAAKKMIWFYGQAKKKEGTMERTYLKKVLTGLSIASLVAGMSGAAMGAGG